MAIDWSYGDIKLIHASKTIIRLCPIKLLRLLILLYKLGGLAQGWMCVTLNDIINKSANGEADVEIDNTFQYC